MNKTDFHNQLINFMSEPFCGNKSFGSTVNQPFKGCNRINKKIQKKSFLPHLIYIYTK